MDKPFDPIHSFRNSEYSQAVLKKILGFSFSKKLRIMEVCGGHTISLLKNGISQLVSPVVQFISGPGCPVCVTPSGYINNAIELSQKEDVIIASYGDMLKLRGANSSLQIEKNNGSDIRICYSILDALQIAKDNPNKKIVFLAVGFETTTPATALAILKAKESCIDNFYVFSAHKTMPEAMRIIAEDKETNIDAFILPGHVASITGVGIFNFLVEQFHKPCVVSGFEPLDLLQSLWMLLQQIEVKKPQLKIQYTRAVNANGNLKAQNIIQEVLEEDDVEWKGLGLIPKSGLRLRQEYRDREITHHISLQNLTNKENPACLCGEVLKGKKLPTDCKLFGKACTPERPLGACMVGGEGACGVYFKYWKK
jgi:hydrogenase expression/formation protein HypD